MQTIPPLTYGTIHQYVVRLNRLHVDREVMQVLYYLDVHVPMLLRMLKKRIAGYEAIGYSVRFGS